MADFSLPDSIPQTPIGGVEATVERGIQSLALGLGGFVALLGVFDVFSDGLFTEDILVVGNRVHYDVMVSVRGRTNEDHVDAGVING